MSNIVGLLEQKFCDITVGLLEQRFCYNTVGLVIRGSAITQ